MESDLIAFFASDVTDHIGYVSKVRALQRSHERKPQADVQSEFHQGGGIAAKVVYLPVGEAIGAMHRFENMNILVYGDITIASPEGMKRLTVEDKPIFIISPAGTKRAAQVHADTCWITLLPSEEKTLEAVESKFLVENEAEFLTKIGA